MEDWFYYNKIRPEKRLDYAIDQLRGEVRRGWRQEQEDRCYYKEPPITTWDEMKKLLRDQYVPKSRKDHTVSKVQRKKRTSSTDLKAEKLKNNDLIVEEIKARMVQIMNEFSQQRRQQSSKPKLSSVQTDQKTSKQPELISPIPESQEKHTQDKSSNTLNLIEIISFKCQDSGHYARDCPTKRKTELTSLEKHNISADVSNDSVDVLCTFTSSMNHLSWSKGVDAGTVAGEHLDKGLNNQGELVEQEDELSLIIDQRKITNLPNEARTCDPRELGAAQHLLFGTRMSETYNLISYWQNFIIGYSFKYSVYEFSISSIMHLFCPMSAQKETGGALDTLAIKEKPPDLCPRTPQQQTRGTYLDSQKRMKPNLLAVGTGSTFLRTRFLETREFDSVTNPSKYQTQDAGVRSNTKEYHKEFGNAFERSSMFKYEPPDTLPLLRSNYNSQQALNHGWIKPILIRARDTEFELGQVSVSVLNLVFASNTDMICLSLSREPNAGFRGAKKGTRRTQRREEDKRFKPPDLDQHQNVSCFMSIKEAPPDATYKLKLMQDKLDLRSNPFQVGEDDMIMDRTMHKKLVAEEAARPGVRSEPRWKKHDPKPPWIMHKLAKEAHSLMAEGSPNLPAIQVFNIFTQETPPGNDN